MIEPYFSITLAFIAALCWGFNAHLVKIGMKGENLYFGLGIRAVSSFPILFGIVLFWKGVKGLTIYFNSEIGVYVLISAILVLIGDAIYMYLMNNYTVNLVAPIVAVYPLFTTFILILSGIESVGILIIVGTTVIVIGVGIVTSGDLSGTFNYKLLFFALITAACWGISIYFVRLVLEYPNTDAIGITGVRMMLIGFIGFVIHFSNSNLKDTRSNRTEESKKNSLIFLGLSGIVGWVIGASLFFYAVQNIGASIPTPISSTNPIVASLIGFFFGIEKLSVKQFGGVVITVIGIILIII